MTENFSLYDRSDVIDIVLYKYNHSDNKLWTGIRNKVEYLEPNDGSIIVTKDQLENFIKHSFKNELNTFNAVGYEVIHKEVNSIYFIANMLKNMQNLRWIKLTLNKNSKYSRLIKDSNGNSQIKFGFKILHMTLKTFDIFETNEEVQMFNKILIDQRILEEGTPYRRIKLNDLIDRLDEWIIRADKKIIESITSTDMDVVDAVANMLDMMSDQKLSGDNPEVLLVTDY
jgi:hypothetical protein